MRVSYVTATNLGKPRQVRALFHIVFNRNEPTLRLKTYFLTTCVILDAAAVAVTTTPSQFHFTSIAIN